MASPRRDPGLCTLTLLLLFLEGCLSSHFRGGMINWKPTDVDNQVSESAQISELRHKDISKRLAIAQSRILIQSDINTIKPYTFTVLAPVELRFTPIYQIVAHRHDS